MSRERRIEFVAAVVLIVVLFGIWFALAATIGKVAATLVGYAICATILWRMRQLITLLDRL